MLDFRLSLCEVQNVDTGHVIREAMFQIASPVISRFVVSWRSEMCPGEWPACDAP